MRENGKVPVQDFLYSLSPKLRAKAFSDIELLRNMGNELRIKFASDIARIFYFTYHNNKYVLLHGFIKKSIKPPKTEIDRARKYMEDYKRRSES